MRFQTLQELGFGYIVIVAKFQLKIITFSVSVHIEFNTVQVLQCKNINFLSPELWPRNSPELNSTDYKIL